MKFFVGLDTFERIPYVCCVQDKVFYGRFGEKGGGRSVEGVAR